MKYLILTLIALLGCLVVGFLLMSLLRRVSGHPKSLPARIVTTLLCAVFADAGDQMPTTIPEEVKRLAESL